MSLPAELPTVPAACLLSAGPGTDRG